jgi:DNA-binding MarR family transcriptional regulator
MVITDPITIERLCDQMVRYHMTPFFAKECTLPDAAARLKITTQRMSYWINKLVKFGLLKFVRFEKRSRHQVAVYRSTEDEYQFSLSAINESHALGLLITIQGEHFKQLQHSIAKNFARHGDRAIYKIWRAGETVFSNVFNPDDPNDAFGFTSTFAQLWLDQQEVEQLHKELRELVAKYNAISNRSKPNRSLLYCGLAENHMLLTDV